jgi:hypothetical protein
MSDLCKLIWCALLHQLGPKSHNVYIPSVTVSGHVDRVERVVDTIQVRFSVPTVAELWREHCDRVIAEWIVENPGTRPSLWWKYDAPEPRQDAESEAVYLKRHGLFLSEGERKRLTKRDFEPEAVV